ncbi:SIMPL domain-containing protein [bacterium]|nr:SIMPL domain-containing protein [bacterium]
MNKKMLLGSVLMLVLCCFSTAAFAKTQGMIYVNETANIDAAPDTVEFSVVVRTSDKVSLEKASKENKEISNKIYDEYRSVINKANGDYIKTTSYSARPVYIWNNGKQNFDKYEVVNTIMIHTKNITDAGSYIDRALKLGATNVNGLNYLLDDRNIYCNDLLAKATKKAKLRAEAVAQASGQRITGIKEIRTSCSADSGRRYSGVMMSKAVMDSSNGAEEAVTQTEGGALKIYASIDADFYVK